MPRDVRTRWNSTYDMLNFALEYKEGIKMLTSDLMNGLRKYELDEEEWFLVKELANTLKVTFSHSHIVTILTQFMCYNLPTFKTLALNSINNKLHLYLHT
jgi:hypothetical protein